MAEKVSNVTELFDQMERQFKGDKAAGMDAVYQFNLTGANGGEYWIHVHDGKMEKGSGTHDNPSITVTAEGDDLIKINNGEMAAMSAFMTGKLKVKGDMGLALKLQSVFGLG